MHNLMGHMHLHSDSKPFKCLYCPSKFTLKGNLTRHMKVKHGVMDRGLDERRKHVHVVNGFNFLSQKVARYDRLFLYFQSFGKEGGSACPPQWASSPTSAKSSHLTSPRSPRVCPTSVSPSLTVRASQEALVRKRMRRACTEGASTALR